jgi:hypothetical protein
MKTKSKWKFVGFMLFKGALSFGVAIGLISLLIWMTGDTAWGVILYIALMWADRGLLLWRLKIVEDRLDEVYEATWQGRLAHSMTSEFMQLRNKRENNNGKHNTADIHE